jgi:hypothetical protein
MSKESSFLRLLFSMFLLSMILLPGAEKVLAQSSLFTFQGRITDPSISANGTYDMKFQLFDTDVVGTGTQEGSDILISSVQATNGIFTVQLDFGAAVFNGSNWFLEITVQGTTLAPRQQLTTTPYAIRSSIATNATQLNGSPASGFIQNGTSQQAATNFSISGNGTLGGTLSAGVVNSATQYNINGNRLLSVPGTDNLFAGISAGASNTTGSFNSFFGAAAGLANTTGSSNSFFGISAGLLNTTGTSNSFFGALAGRSNKTGGSNSFFGINSGFSNTTGDGNSFFGAKAGVANTTGSSNSFFGQSAGVANTTGDSNSFFGAAAGAANTTGIFNAFFGDFAGFSNTTGLANSFFGHRAGPANTSGSFNSFFGQGAGAANTTGFDNSFFGANAGDGNTTGKDNSFFGAAAGFSNTTGSSNSFFGLLAGTANTTASNNSFFGESAGRANTSGDGNSFFGDEAGFSNTTGSFNSFFGEDAGAANTTGFGNSFFGDEAGFSNTIGIFNAFFGLNAGIFNTTGSNNAFFGQSAGRSNSTGVENTFIGNGTGQSNTTGTRNTYIGASSSGSNGISNATAIGAGATVSASNTMVLGTSAVTVRIPGSLVVTGTVSKGGGSFKIDHPLDPTNKTLSHSFVESPDMMNIYNGNAVLDRRGEAVITLPAYFEALNRDFRYHLTCIGSFAPVYIAKEIKGDRFKIAGGKPGMKISWQVTGVRQDAYANAHRIPVEEDKPASERGSYLHPDAFNKLSTKQAHSDRESRVKQKGGKRR